VCLVFEELDTSTHFLRADFERAYLLIPFAAGPAAAVEWPVHYLKTFK
jgi:hypothetical protein